MFIPGCETSSSPSNPWAGRVKYVQQAHHLGWMAALETCCLARGYRFILENADQPTYLEDRNREEAVGAADQQRFVQALNRDSCMRGEMKKSEDDEAASLQSRLPIDYAFQSRCCSMSMYNGRKIENRARGLEHHSLPFESNFKCVLLARTVYYSHDEREATTELRRSTRSECTKAQAAATWGASNQEMGAIMMKDGLSPADLDYETSIQSVRIVRGWDLFTTALHT